MVRVPGVLEERVLLITLLESSNVLAESRFESPAWLTIVSSVAGCVSTWDFVDDKIPNPKYTNVLISLSFPSPPIPYIILTVPFVWVPNCECKGVLHAWNCKNELMKIFSHVLIRVMVSFISSDLFLNKLSHKIVRDFEYQCGQMTHQFPCDKGLDEAGRTWYYRVTSHFVLNIYQRWRLRSVYSWG